MMTKTKEVQLTINEPVCKIWEISSGVELKRSTKITELILYCVERGWEIKHIYNLKVELHRWKQYYRIAHIALLTVAVLRLFFIQGT